MGKSQYIGRKHFGSWSFHDEVKAMKPLFTLHLLEIHLIINKLAPRSPINSMPKIKIMNKEISSEAFKREVINNANLSIVQFKKNWNGACQIIAPIYEELARSYVGQADFFSIDIDQHHGFETEYGIMEVPTILFFKSGNVVDHSTGLTPKNILIHKIERALSASN